MHQNVHVPFTDHVVVYCIIIELNFSSKMFTSIINLLTHNEKKMSLWFAYKKNVFMICPTHHNVPDIRD